MVRINESHARDVFRTLLRELGTTTQHWRRGPEPPDFYLRTPDRSFAVEVTRVMEVYQIGNQSSTTQGVRHALNALARRIERTARERGLLSGTYVLRLVPIPDLRRRESEVVARALHYISQTRDSGSVPACVLGIGTLSRHVTIKKVHADRAQVVGGIGIGPLKRGSTVVADLQRLVGASVQGKRAKLAHTRLPRILLLVDSYIYGEAQHWSEAVSSLDLAGFHTIARIFRLGSDALLTRQTVGHRRLPNS